MAWGTHLLVAIDIGLQERHGSITLQAHDSSRAVVASLTSTATSARWRTHGPFQARHRNYVVHRTPSNAADTGTPIL